LPYVGIHYRQRENSVSDRYRKADKLAGEVTQINLASLHRYRAAGGRLNGDLMENWWRLWRNWRRMKNGEQADPQGEAVEKAGYSFPALPIPAPPLPVAAYGMLRHSGSAWRQRLWACRP
jgi:hypothetical protein